MAEYLIPFVVQNPWCSTFIVFGAAGAATAFALLSPYFSTTMTKMIPESETQSQEVPVSIFARTLLTLVSNMYVYLHRTEIMRKNPKFSRQSHQTNA